MRKFPIDEGKHVPSSYSLIRRINEKRLTLRHLSQHFCAHCKNKLPRTHHHKFSKRQAYLKILIISERKQIIQAPTS